MPEKGIRCLTLAQAPGLSLLMEAKYHCSHLTGLEIQEESADMARRSVALNDLQDRIDIVTGDTAKQTRFSRLLPLTVLPAILRI